MDRLIPMGRFNQMLLLLSASNAILCLVVQHWVGGLQNVPLYLTLLWILLVTIFSTWLSCFAIRLTLKANNPLEMTFLEGWLRKRLRPYLRPVEKSQKESNKSRSKNLESTLTQEMKSRLINSWYDSVSQDKTFPQEADNLLGKMIERVVLAAEDMDKMKAVNKVADVLLVHLKEYRRSVKRVEKGAAKSIEDAYKYSHPGSKSSATLDYSLRRLVAILAGEFLQWELTNTLPYKLLISILAKKLLGYVETVSSPGWIYRTLLESVDDPSVSEAKGETENVILSNALGDGIVSATAAVIPRPLPKQQPNGQDPGNDQSRVGKVGTEDHDSSEELKSSLCLEGLSSDVHRGLWGGGGLGIGMAAEAELDLDLEDRVSPVYEEPTDFATTIARLRSLLQQKSTASTPLHAEEKSYVVFEGSQFTNLAIPWTEFYTAQNGSQQLLYCIQFDDVEQHGVNTFETTTATVRRQYTDFVQLHASLEEVPSLAEIMSNLTLPEGGRAEMESYLRNLCTQLANESPPQLRHFLRPNSGAGRKAEAVAPRFDRFLAKTVTGVFNTLKTVVPGFEMDQEEDVPPLPTLMPLSDIPWRFVQEIKSKNLVGELQQLVADRIDYCSVDTAYEAVESVETNGDSDLLAHWWETVNTCYEEEIDELDANLTLTCAGIDLLCELLAAVKSNNVFQQEAVVRWTKLFLGNITESLLKDAIGSILSGDLGVPSLTSVMTLPEEEPNPSPGSKSRSGSTTETGSGSETSASPGTGSGMETLERMQAELCESIERKLPNKFLNFVLGTEDFSRMVRCVIGSLVHKRINRDLTLQILDIFASQLLASCKASGHRSCP